MSAESTPALALRGIVKRFPGVLANDRVDLEVASGEVHALLGENGAGKSTISNVITGLYRPDAGEIRMHGRRVEFHSPRDALEAGIFMVHQHFRLVPAFTAAENVVLGFAPGRERRVRLDRGAIEREVAARRRALRPRRRSRRAAPGSCRSASSSGWRSSRRSTATPAC